MFWLATLTFAAVYIGIVSEKVNKTTAALCGAAVVLCFRVVSVDEALFDAGLGVDWGVIFLLISMMIIVNILARTGLFQYVAVRAAKMGRGEPFRVMIILAVVTAVASSFLDNVTTVLLMAPVTLVVAQQLETDPIPMLITEALASNIGGTATLIGDPPNIMIGSRAGLSFLDFLVHVAPGVVVIMISWLLAWKLVFSSRMKAKPELCDRIMAMDENRMIVDPALLKKSAVILALVIAGFLSHSLTRLDPSVVAFTGAAFLLLLTKENPAKALSEVEWPTVCFFIGLFIIVGATVKVGMIEILSKQVISVTKPQPDNMFGLTMAVVWFSGLASAIVDNIPYVATMNPLIIETTRAVYGSVPAHVPPAVMPVWWALSLGACLGGNGTAIGASANVVVCGISERAGHKITFARFLKYGAPTTLFTIAVSAVYLWLRYYVVS
ncbi:MAG: ArsB/NhaD family transporter [Thermodesulfobacteriota bacterium]